jgi:hypothetical protein
MSLSRLLLAPYRFFRPPTLRTPFSTLKMPPLFLTALLCAASFVVVASGFVFCFVSGIPLVWYSRDARGAVVAEWISPNGLAHQYLAEGIVAALTFALGAGALLSAFYEATKREREKGGADRWLAAFAYTAPAWPLIALLVYRLKIPSYLPRFFTPA